MECPRILHFFYYLGSVEKLVKLILKISEIMQPIVFLVISVTVSPSFSCNNINIQIIS
jgi:hypothetical protein